MSKLRTAVNPALALLSAIFLILTFPEANQVWLAPFAVTPLLCALGREPRPLHRFLLGWICGIVYWFGVCYWIQGTLERYGDMGVFGSWGTFVLFCLIKALHTGVFSMLAAVLLPTWYAIPGIAALWVAIERTQIVSGFAWLCLGNAGIGMAVPLRLAPWMGVYGLSFLFALLASSAALVILRRARKELLWLAATLGLFLLPDLPELAQGDQTAVLVQGNIPEDQEWTPGATEQMRESLIALSLEQSAGAHPRLIVWPETPGPIYYYRDAALRASVTDLARITGASVLFGTVGETPQGAPLNSAAMLNPAGELVDRYDKVNLVPFGEYVPKAFDFVNRITKEAGDFTPGSRMVVFPAGDRRLAVFICYESVFPSEVRQFVKSGAELLVNISNDGYFGATAARGQHLEIVRMRAVENRRWLLRATNDGITASIDPAGRVRERLPSFQKAAGRFRFAFESGVTGYTLLGDWFAWGCLGAAAVALFCSQWPHYTARAKTVRNPGTP